MATTCALVFQTLVPLSLFVYSNPTLLELQTLLYLFLSKIYASKLGVWLIYRCGLYTDVYGKRHNAKVLVYSVRKLVGNKTYHIHLPVKCSVGDTIALQVRTQHLFLSLQNQV